MVPTSTRPSQWRWTVRGPCHTFSCTTSLKLRAANCCDSRPDIIPKEIEGTLQIKQTTWVETRRIPMVAADDWINMVRPAPMITPMTGRSPRPLLVLKGCNWLQRSTAFPISKLRQRKFPTPNKIRPELLLSLNVSNSSSAAPGKSLEDSHQAWNQS